MAPRDFDLPFLLLQNQQGNTTVAPYKVCDWTALLGPTKRGDASQPNDDGGVVEELRDEWSTTAVAEQKPARKNIRSRSITEEYGGRPMRNTIGGGGVRKLGWGLKNTEKRFKSRVPSVTVDPSWTLVEEIEFTQLSRLQFQPDEESVVVAKASGTALQYDRANDRISLKYPKQMVLDTSLPVRHQTTSKDSVLRAMEVPMGKTAVYTTDLLCAFLMTCPRPFIPWDLLITKAGNRVIIDKRDESDLDLVHLNETAMEDKDEADQKRLSAQDATLVNTSVAFNLCRPAEQRAPVHQYRELRLGDSMVLFVRTEVDAVVAKTSVTSAPTAGDEQQTIFVRSVLDNDAREPNGEWQKKLDSQRGAILVRELRNNNALMSRWVLQAILAEADIFKLAYTVRTPNYARKDDRFSVVAVEDYDPIELSAQIGLNLPNAFGILKALVDTVIKLPSPASETHQKYILLKDPNKPVMRIYAI